MNNEENNASRLFTDNEWPRILNIVYTGPAWWEESESPPLPLSECEQLGRTLRPHH